MQLFAVLLVVLHIVLSNKCKYLLKSKTVSDERTIKVVVEKRMFYNEVDDETNYCMILFFIIDFSFVTF